MASTEVGLLRTQRELGNVELWSRDEEKSSAIDTHKLRMGKIEREY